MEVDGEGVRMDVDACLCISYIFACVCLYVCEIGKAGFVCKS